MRVCFPFRSGQKGETRNLNEIVNRFEKQLQVMYGTLLQIIFIICAAS